VIVSLAIAVWDKDGTRSKTGDIIAVKPGPWQWGGEERKRFLLVNVDLGSLADKLTFLSRLSIPDYGAGQLDQPAEATTYVAKRRFAIPLADLQTFAASKAVTIDLVKLRDVKVDYQPLEGKTIPIAGYVYDKCLARKATTQDLEMLRK
jgi:hypothetical protein